MTIRSTQKPDPKNRAMDKITVLRQIFNKYPVVAEQIINRWGSDELRDYLESVIASAPRTGVRVSEGLLTGFRHLMRVHGEEFPEYADVLPESLMQIPPKRQVYSRVSLHGGIF